MRWTLNKLKHGDLIERKVFALIPTEMTESNEVVWLENYIEVSQYSDIHKESFVIKKKVIDK